MLYECIWYYASRRRGWWVSWIFRPNTVTPDLCFLCLGLLFSLFSKRYLWRFGLIVHLTCQPCAAFRVLVFINFVLPCLKYRRFIRQTKRLSLPWYAGHRWLLKLRWNFTYSFIFLHIINFIVLMAVVVALPLCCVGSLLFRMRPLWFYPLHCHMTSYYRLSRSYAFACHYSSLLIVCIFSFPLAPFARHKPFSYTSRLLLFPLFYFTAQTAGCSSALVDYISFALSSYVGMDLV